MIALAQGSFCMEWERLPSSYFQKSVGTELFVGHNDVVDFITERFDEYLKDYYDALGLHRVGLSVMGPKTSHTLWQTLKKDLPELYRRMTNTGFSFWLEFIASYGGDFAADAAEFKKLKQASNKQGEKQ